MNILIDQDGWVHAIKSDELSALRDEGVTETLRASHVEPTSVVLRVLFHSIRRSVSDSSMLAAFTRRWRCEWRARIFGGPTLRPFSERAAAIAAEVEWLNTNRL